MIYSQMIPGLQRQKQAWRAMSMRMIMVALGMQRFGAGGRRVRVDGHVGGVEGLAIGSKPVFGRLWRYVPALDRRQERDGHHLHVSQYICVRVHQVYENVVTDVLAIL